MLLLIFCCRWGRSCRVFVFVVVLFQFFGYVNWVFFKECCFNKIFVIWFLLFFLWMFGLFCLCLFWVYGDFCFWWFRMGWCFFCFLCWEVLVYFFVFRMCVFFFYVVLENVFVVESSCFCQGVGGGGVFFDFIYGIL